MSDKSALAGMSTNELIVLAGAFLCSRQQSDVDYEKLFEMAGSKTVGAVRERLRLAKKKSEQLLGATDGTSTPSEAPKKGKKAAPAGGIDKKSPTKVKAGPRKAAASKVKSEEHIDEEIDDEGI